MDAPLGALRAAAGLAGRAGVTGGALLGLTYGMVAAPGHWRVVDLFPLYGMCLLVGYLALGPGGAVMAAGVAILAAGGGMILLDLADWVRLASGAGMVAAVAWGLVRYAELSAAREARWGALRERWEDRVRRQSADLAGEAGRGEALAARMAQYRALGLAVERLAALPPTETEGLPGSAGELLRVVGETAREVLGGPTPVLTAEPSGLFERWVAQRRTPLLVEDLHRDFRFDVRAAPAGVRSFVGAPLIVEGRVAGILRQAADRGAAYRAVDLRLLSALAGLASVALENAALLVRTRELAVTDGLTGLANHRFLMERLGEECARARRLGSGLSLLMADVDHFKRYNDTHGHQAGDEALVSVAALLRRQIRRTDFVGRFGGEEFVVLLPETPVPEAQGIAEELRRRCERSLPVTLSIGVAEGHDPETLLAAADGALYGAKAAGRNRVGAA